MKTKKQIQKYNKEYSSRPEVKAWAKVRNVRPERKAVRKAYKKSANGLAYERLRRSNPEIKLKYENWRLKARYGITLEQYEAMFIAQQGRCAICNREDSNRLHVDHNHTSGKVRSLLCGSCNRGIGMFAEDVKLLEKAIKYLKKADI